MNGATFSIRLFFFSQALLLVLALDSAVFADDDRLEILPADPLLLSRCDLAEPLSVSERENLFSKLRISIAGKKVLDSFIEQYESTKNLVIQWDSVSYSQIDSLPARRRPEIKLGRIIASVASNKKALGHGVCIHLAKNLPEIEHLADLAHELTHVTRLEYAVLKGLVKDVDHFVRARLQASGGEADAFSVECTVKKEILGHWDTFCSPYVVEGWIDQKKVVSDFYNGTLSASLTGETYPVLLARQYRSMLSRRNKKLKNQEISQANQYEQNQFSSTNSNK